MPGKVRKIFYMEEGEYIYGKSVSEGSSEENQ